MPSRDNDEAVTEHALDLSREASYAVTTIEMIEKEQARIGTVLSRPEPYIELTSRDAIRHWVQGIGDRNPLYTDAAYGASSPWGDIIAAPTIAMALTSNLPSGFRGLHAWHLGTSLEWSQPIRRDRTFKAIDTYESLTEVNSSYVGGHTWDQVIRSEIHDVATGDVVVVQRLFIRRFERDRGREVAKEARQRTRYSAEELRAIAEETLNEYRRGAEPFAATDVTVGDSIGPIVRGPLTSVDCLAFVRGWGGAYILAHGSMWEFLAKHPGAFPPDSSGVPDSPERTHWSDEFARAVGAPMAFDYGPQRIAWCGTLVTNWMGDAALLRGLSVRLRKPNYHGDIVRISGKVTAVDSATETISLSLEGHNQLMELVVEGDAVVQLNFASSSAGQQR